MVTVVSRVHRIVHRRVRYVRKEWVCLEVLVLGWERTLTSVVIRKEVVQEDEAAASCDIPSRRWGPSITVVPATVARDGISVRHALALHDIVVRLLLLVGVCRVHVVRLKRGRRRSIRIPSLNFWVTPLIIWV